MFGVVGGGGDSGGAGFRQESFKLKWVPAISSVSFEFPPYLSSSRRIFQGSRHIIFQVPAILCRLFPPENILHVPAILNRIEYSY